MLGHRRFSVLTSFACLTGFLFCSSQPAEASVRVVAFKCEENGDVTFIVGDSIGILANQRDIIIDGVAIRLDSLTTRPAATDLDGSIQNIEPYDTAANNVASWLKVTVQAGTISPGQHTITVPNPEQFSLATGLVLPWTPTIDCGPVDSDGDGVPDSEDAFPNDPTEQTDNDGDGIGDNADLDDDNDGLTDAEEAIIGTDPLIADTDNDGVDDGADPRPLDAEISTFEGFALFIRDDTLSQSVIPDEALRNRRLRRPLQQKMTVVIRLLQLIELQDDPRIADFLIQITIMKIEDDLLAKTDGVFGGNPRNDWVIDPDAQELLYGDLVILVDALELLL